ncbi:hypothetical protein [Streptomyces mirabilis]|uniref:hypothetical protein n=1 Tax=Streptomyces mirabilis TaxID=68239 RepID=UPI0033BF7FAB
MKTRFLWKAGLAAAGAALLGGLAVTPSAAAPSPTLSVPVAQSLAAYSRSTDCNDLHITATYTISGNYSWLNSVSAYETDGYDKLSTTTIYYRADGGNTTFTSNQWSGGQDDDFSWSPGLGGVALSRTPYLKVHRKSLGGLATCDAYIHLY